MFVHMDGGEVWWMDGWRAKWMDGTKRRVWLIAFWEIIFHFSSTWIASLSLTMVNCGVNTWLLRLFWRRRDVRSKEVGEEEEELGGAGLRAPCSANPGQF